MLMIYTKKKKLKMIKVVGQKVDILEALFDSSTVNWS